MRIIYEGFVPHPAGYAATRFAVEGSTAEEISEWAFARAREIGMVLNDDMPMIASGIHNNREDWEAIFGPSKPGHVFGDDPEVDAAPSNVGMLRRFIAYVRGKR